MKSEYNHNVSSNCRKKNFFHPISHHEMNDIVLIVTMWLSVVHYIMKIIILNDGNFDFIVKIILGKKWNVLFM